MCLAFSYSEFLSKTAGYAWGMPLVVLLFGTGLYLAFVSRLMPLRGFGRALALLSGRVRHEGDERAEGEITYFQGLATAISRPS